MQTRGHRPSLGRGAFARWRRAPTPLAILSVALSLSLLASGSCSVNTDYEFGDEEEGDAGAQFTGGPARESTGGAGSALGSPCTERPCANGGVCRQTQGGFACACPDGFSGPVCESAAGGRTNTSGGRANANGGVVSTTGGGSGSGNVSSSGSSQGGSAGATNPCFPNPCQHGGYCYVTGAVSQAGYRCECNNGYEGLDCKVDTDECATSPGPCTNGETCRNFPGTFGCPCPVGFVGADCDLPTLEWLTLPEEWRACAARDVSDDGTVVVGYCNVTPEGKRAFRWTHEQGMSFLGTLGNESSADAVSGDGKVIVGTYVADQRHMFRWTAAGGMQAELGLAGEIGSEAYDVSADGSVVVGMSHPSGAGFRWSAAERLNLGEADTSGRVAAWAVSGDGAVVVGSNESVGAAFRWTAATGVQLLPTSSRGGEIFARAISRDGKIIAGYGISDTDSWGLIWKEGTVEVLEGMDQAVRAVSNTGVVVTTYAVWNGQLRTPLQAIEDLGILPDQVVSSIGSISANGKFYVGFGAGGPFIARSPK